MRRRVKTRVPPTSPRWAARIEVVVLALAPRAGDGGRPGWVGPPGLVDGEVVDLRREEDVAAPSCRLGRRRARGVAARLQHCRRRATSNQEESPGKRL